jgi:hypothetical protein
MQPEGVHDLERSVDGTVEPFWRGPDGVTTSPP